MCLSSIVAGRFASIQSIMRGLLAIIEERVDLVQTLGLWFLETQTPDLLTHQHRPQLIENHDGASQGPIIQPEMPACNRRFANRQRRLVAHARKVGHSLKTACCYPAPFQIGPFDQDAVEALTDIDQEVRFVIGNPFSRFELNWKNWWMPGSSSSRSPEISRSRKQILATERHPRACCYRVGSPLGHLDICETAAGPPATGALAKSQRFRPILTQSNLEVRLRRDIFKANFPSHNEPSR